MTNLDLEGARWRRDASSGADHVVESDHGMFFELKNHKAKKTGKPRRILLAAEMVKASRAGLGP